MGLKVCEKIEAESGLSQRQTALAAGFSHQAWSRLRLHTTNPPLETILKLWEYCEKELKWTAKRFLGEL